jgi:hyaluronan synthase
LQLLFSHFNHRYYKNLPIEVQQKTENLYKTTLLVVGHRERPDYWMKCLESIKKIESQNLLKIYIVIDGNEEEDNYMRDLVLDHLEDSSIDIETIQIAKRGKRGAMFFGFNKIKSDFHNQIRGIDVVVTDSDTVIEKDSIQQLQTCLRSNPNNGCATGFLYIYNLEDGILPKMINSRYAYAFMIERGATSYYGCMTCCSGPISIYRLDVLDELVLRKFISQSFLTIPCEPGDDRHLTNLVMALGYNSRQTNLARAGTEAPETWYRFSLQQLRWSRSYYRELYWQFKALEKQSWYLVFVAIYETVFPIFVSSWLIISLYLRQDMTIFIRGIIISFTILIVKTILLLLYIRNKHLMLNILYFPVYLFLLLPTKLYASISLLNNHWVTAPRNNKGFLRWGPNFMFFSFVAFWDILILTGVVIKILTFYQIL